MFEANLFNNNLQSLKNQAILALFLQQDNPKAQHALNNLIKTWMRDPTAFKKTFFSVRQEMWGRLLKYAERPEQENTSRWSCYFLMAFLTQEHITVAFDDNQLALLYELFLGYDGCDFIFTYLMPLLAPKQQQDLLPKLEKIISTTSDSYGSGIFLHHPTKQLFLKLVLQQNALIHEEWVLERCIETLPYACQETWDLLEKNPRLLSRVLGESGLQKLASTLRENANSGHIVREPRALSSIIKLAGILDKNQFFALKLGVCIKLGDKLHH